MQVIRGLDLLIRPGEIFGLLGAPGTGKSTAIALLCTLIRPTTGSLWVAGHDVHTAPTAVRGSVGVVLQHPTLDLGLTVQENLRLHAALHGMTRRRAHRRITAMLTLTGLLRRRHCPVRVLAQGTRRKLEITRALLHRPQVLLLDEPTHGLDAHDHEQVWQHVHRMHRTTGVTVLSTIRRADEAHHCDRLALLQDGRTVAVQDPSPPPTRPGQDHSPAPARTIPLGSPLLSPPRPCPAPVLRHRTGGEPTPKTHT